MIEEEEPIGCIYAIECLVNDDFYIGSTLNLDKRIKRHKSNTYHSKEKFFQKLYVNVRENGGWDNYKFVIVEENIISSQLRKQEQFYFELLSPSLNSINPILTRSRRRKMDIVYRKRAYERNPEKIKEKWRNAYWNNKEKRLAYKAQKKLCECGCYVRNDAYARHKTCNKHKKLLEQKKKNIKVI